MEILNYIKTLEEDSFESWTEEEQVGYKTALISVREKIKELSVEKKVSGVVCPKCNSKNISFNQFREIHRCNNCEILF